METGQQSEVEKFRGERKSDGVSQFCWIDLKESYVFGLIPSIMYHEPSPLACLYIWLIRANVQHILVMDFK